MAAPPSEPESRRDAAAGEAPGEPEDYIERLVRRMRAGDESALEEYIAEHRGYLERIVRRELSRRKMRDYDECDVCDSVFMTLVMRCRDGKLASLQNAAEMWALMHAIAHRKLRAPRRQLLAQKRGGGAVPASLRPDQALAPDREGPLRQAINNETWERLMSLLKDPGLRGVAELLFQGYTNAEIAEIYEISERAVEYRRARIRKLWARELTTHELDD